jgi:hypothetical protein
MNSPKSHSEFETREQKIFKFMQRLNASIHPGRFMLNLNNEQDFEAVNLGIATEGDQGEEMKVGRGRKSKWVKETILVEASKYDSLYEFYKCAGGAYQKARDLGLLADIQNNMTGGNVRWSKEKVIVDALKYGTKKDWQAESPSAYATARKLGVFDEATKHMTGNTNWESEDIKRDKDLVLKDAKKYKTKNEWHNNSRRAFDRAKELSIFEQATKHMDNMRTRWNEKLLLAEAARYTSELDWDSKSHNSYVAAKRRGAEFFQACLKNLKKAG